MFFYKIIFNLLFLLIINFLNIRSGDWYINVFYEIGVFQIFEVTNSFFYTGLRSCYNYLFLGDLKPTIIPNVFQLV